MENNEIGKDIKIKRIIFIIIIFALFLACFVIMNNKYDPLARYPYANKENRQIILDHLDNEQIDYIVSQKIKPEQFMGFINLDNFDVKKTLYYDAAINERAADPQYIVNFVNSYAKNMNLNTFKDYVAAYTYAQLTNFFNGQYHYDKDAKLIENPQAIDLTIDKGETLYQYEPSDLVEVSYSDIPYMTSMDYGQVIKVKSEVLNPMVKMSKDLESVNHQQNGGLILVSGYLSYNQQVELYNKELAKYGADNVKKHMRLPGENEEQLGYTINFSIANVNSIENSEQYKWLKSHAHEYGFIIRYPKDKEDETGMEPRLLTFRYVGKDLATKLYEEDKVLDEQRDN